MNSDKISHLHQLKAKEACPRKYRCFSEPLKNICHAKYHAISNLMECLEDKPNSCGKATPFGAIDVCQCALRKYIALNFSDIYPIKIAAY